MYIKELQFYCTQLTFVICTESEIPKEVVWNQKSKFVISVIVLHCGSSSITSISEKDTIRRSGYLHPATNSLETDNQGIVHSIERRSPEDDQSILIETSS